MARDPNSYVDVIMDDIQTHPLCPHGPTLLFRRKNKFQDRKFYACSACRNRKFCQFFHWADEEITEKKKEIWELERKEFVSQRNLEELFSATMELKKYLEKKLITYCHTCSTFQKRDMLKEHTGHDIYLNITDQLMSHPTELLKPLEASKKEAQYLFSRRSTETIINIARNVNIQSIICIGTPRIHEYVRCNCKGEIKSILMDFDWRYSMFYSPEEFCWFNSFNNHFLNGEIGRSSFVKFLQNSGKKVMIITDPPFGGRLEPLTYTIKCIQDLHREVNPRIQNIAAVLLIYPYFMERHVVANCSTLKMLDYKITYDNHPRFTQGLKAKQPSPVRIFTNINLKDAILPAEEGYKYCKQCEKWVSEENGHCEFCEKCTSKNGVTYKHCFQCQICVKPSWNHCNKCKRCCLAPHVCGSFVPTNECYKCGEIGHKKYECPNNLDDMECNTTDMKHDTKRKKVNKSSEKKKKKRKL